jgi:hypothetical protein
MTLFNDMARRCLTIAAENKRLGRLLAEAARLDAAGDPPLPPVEAARLLLRLDRLAYCVEALADRLAAGMPLACVRTAQDKPAPAPTAVRPPAVP